MSSEYKVDIWVPNENPPGEIETTILTTMFYAKQCDKMSVKECREIAQNITATLERFDLYVPEKEPEDMIDWHSLTEAEQNNFLGYGLSPSNLISIIDIYCETIENRRNLESNEVEDNGG